MSVVTQILGDQSAIQGYDYRYYWPSPDWRLRHVVEAWQPSEQQPERVWYAFCNLTGEYVPWDDEFDRTRARREAEAAQRMGFHL